MPESRQVVVASLPEGALRPDDFAVRTAEVGEPGEGEVRCRTLALTIGAGQRAGLQGSASYAGTPEADRVMGGTALARVEASGDASLAEGDLVVGMIGWQELSLQPARSLTKVDGDVDAATQLGLLGTNGITAYVGVLDLGRPQPGETVLVSAAAGSVGHVAGQIAKRAGSRVVGVAGTPEKCRVLVDELGFDEAIDHRSVGFRDALRAATPDRIDVYFDNVGGAVLQSALFRMAVRGRIVCCGAASQYDTSTPEPGPRGIPGLLVNNRVRMEGFIIFDHLDRYADARRDLRAWAADGTITAKATEYEGLEAAPHAFVDLLAGRTVGTTIVHVAS